MKLQSLALVSLASVALAAPSWWEQYTLGKHKSVINFDEDRRLVQVSEDQAPFWTTEQDRMDMLRGKINYMDITDHQDLGTHRISTLGKRRKFLG